MMKDRLDGGWSDGMYTDRLLLFFVAERMDCWMVLYVPLIRIRELFSSFSNRQVT